jgi:hypothetical protein
MELGRMPIALLCFGFLDAAVIYVGDTVATGLHRALVFSIVPFVVLCWIGWRQRAMKDGRKRPSA